MISQLTRHSQLVTIPQAALLTTSNASTRQESNLHCLPSSSAAYQMRNNATLRSTRSVPAIVYHQQQQAQQQQLIHQQMLFNHHQNSNNFNNAIDNLDSCPVHGSNAINPLTANHNSSTSAIHQNQLLPATQISNNRSSSILNMRKFASDANLHLSNRPAVNYLQTANSQLMPVFTVANHNLSTPIKTNQIQAAIRNPTINDAKLAMTTNLLPLPIHPSTIYTQPIQIARPPVLIPTFTTEPNFAIAKHNKDQLINIVNSNQADACCKGHLIVLWIILAIVIVGIVSGIILGLTI